MARGSLGIASLLCVLVQTAWTGVTNNTVSMPTFCPPNSTTFAVVQRLSLSSATPDASIYYTLDGTLPTVGNASLFNAASPISLSTTTTVKVPVRVSVVLHHCAAGSGICPWLQLE